MRQVSCQAQKRGRPLRGVLGSWFLVLGCHCVADEQDYLPLVMRLVSWLALSKMVDVSQP